MLTRVRAPFLDKQLYEPEHVEHLLAVNPIPLASCELSCLDGTSSMLTSPKLQHRAPSSKDSSLLRVMVIYGFYIGIMEEKMVI